MSMYNYLGIPNNNLICCICRAPFLDPLTSKLCSHTFCSSCIHQALSHSAQCPIDRTPLKEGDLETAPNIVRSMVNELEVECVYAPPRREELGEGDAIKGKGATNSPPDATDPLYGCRWTGERETLGAHLEVCEYAEGNKDKEKNRDPHIGQARIDEDGAQHNTDLPSGTLSISENPTTTDTPSPRFEGRCPHAAFGCPYITPTDLDLSSELGSEDSSAITQADIETHLTSCPYESLKGFFEVFSSTVASQKKAIEDSKRREDTLHATILELKENEKRAKLVLEQNILLKKRLESLEGVVTTLKKELTNIRAALGPWATGASTSQNMHNSTSAADVVGTDLSGMNRYMPPTGSISGGFASSLTSAPSPPTTTFPMASSASDRSSELANPSTHPMHHAVNSWGPILPELHPVHGTSPFANFTPRVDDTIPGNPALSNEAFASFFPNQGEEYPTGMSSHPQHHRTTSSTSMPLMIPPLDISSSLERTLQRLNASIVSVATAVEGLSVQIEGVARRGEIGLANEAVRVGEEIGSLRAQIYGLRMLVHGLMVERGVGTRWPSANPGGVPGMNMADSDDEQRIHPGPSMAQTIPMGMPPPPPFFLRNNGIGMGLGPMGGPSITKL